MTNFDLNLFLECLVQDFGYSQAELRKYEPEEIRELLRTHLVKCDEESEE